MTPVHEPVITASPDAAGLTGTGPHRALFLDRDGVINVDHGYVHQPEQTDWVPGIFDVARAARRAGYVLVVVTNQAGIARGYYGVEQFTRYTQWVHRVFEREGAELLATYFCPHHAEAGTGAWKVACQCRKPKAGMLEAAILRFDLDARRSIMIGDNVKDAEAGRAAGVGCCIVANDPQVVGGPLKHLF